MSHMQDVTKQNTDEERVTVAAVAEKLKRDKTLWGSEWNISEFAWTGLHYDKMQALI